MFADALILSGILAQLAAEQAFERSMRELPPDIAATLRKERDECQERYRQEATAERRHRELCEAIRSTSFWRIGG